MSDIRNHSIYIVMVEAKEAYLVGLLALSTLSIIISWMKYRSGW